MSSLENTSQPHLPTWFLGWLNTENESQDIMLPEYSGSVVKVNNPACFEMVAGSEQFFSLSMCPTWKQIWLFPIFEFNKDNHSFSALGRGVVMGYGTNNLSIEIHLLFNVTSMSFVCGGKLFQRIGKCFNRHAFINSRINTVFADRLNSYGVW